MRVVAGNLNYMVGKQEFNNIVLFCSSSYITKKKELVMSRYFAKEIKNWSIRTHGSNVVGKEFGESIKHLSIFGIQFIKRYIGAFQTQVAFNEPPDLGLIDFSASILANIAKATPYITYHCEMPSIGDSQVYQQLVLKELNSHKIPDNVIFYK